MDVKRPRTSVMCESYSLDLLVSPCMFALFVRVLKYKNSKGDPRISIDMLRVKTSGYNSWGTTRRTQTLDKEATQGSVQQQYWETASRRALGTEFTYATHAKHASYFLKNYLGQNQRVPIRITTSQIRLRRFRVKIDMSKSPIKYGGVFET